MNKKDFRKPHALRNPYRLWLMISDAEHELYVALSRGKTEEIERYAKIIRDLMIHTLQQIKEKK